MYIFLVTSLFFLVFGAVPVYSNSPQTCFQDAGCSRWSLERGVWNFCCQVLLCGAAEILFIMWFLYQNTQDRVFLTKTSQSDRWLSLCIADCYPRASSDCSSFLESSATRRCLGKQSDTFQRKVEYDRGESAPKVLPGRTWGCRKQKNAFFFFLWVSPTPRNGQCRLWLGEEITGEGALSSVKHSTNSCHLDANYIVFTYQQGQELSKETFYPVVQL